MAVGRKSCYCLDLETGLNLFNGYIFFLIVQDYVFQKTYGTINMFYGGFLIRPMPDNTLLIYGYAIAVICVGSIGMQIRASRARGLFLNLWRALIIGFGLIWLLHVGYYAYGFSTFELTELITTVFASFKSMKALPVFRWIEPALEWHIIDNSGTGSWAIWVTRNYSFILFFWGVVPLCVFWSGLSHLTGFIQLTSQGRVEYDEALRIRKTALKRRLKERKALLGRPEKLVSRDRTI
jgi:hypothetical protein